MWYIVCGKISLSLYTFLFLAGIETPQILQALIRPKPGNELRKLATANTDATKTSVLDSLEAEEDQILKLLLEEEKKSNVHKRSPKSSDAIEAPEIARSRTDEMKDVYGIFGDPFHYPMKSNDGGVTAGDANVRKYYRSLKDVPPVLRDVVARRPATARRSAYRTGDNVDIGGAGQVSPNLLQIPQSPRWPQPRMIDLAGRSLATLSALPKINYGNLVAGQGSAFDPRIAYQSPNLVGSPWQAIIPWAPYRASADEIINRAGGKP